MKAFFIVFAAVLTSIVLLDAVWLGLMAKPFYLPHIKHLAAKEVNFAPVVIFYLVYAAILTYLIVLPGIGGSYASLFFKGALFGLAAYAAYNLTNQATLRDWPLIVTIVDTSWGTVLAGTASVTAAYAADYFGVR